jgi:4-amino-4-deoxy-L-arabinose transferase-like glycosyltransferase
MSALPHEAQPRAPAWGARRGTPPLAGAAPPWRVLLAAGLALFALRAAVMLASGAGLHVDEAQYWDWSRSLQWGYYSKPPGIAALIALGTGLAGDAGRLAVRWLPMLCWIASGWVLAALAARMVRDTLPGSDPLRPARARAAALWTFALYAGTPAAGLLGMAATTDAPLMLAWALAMAAGWRALQAGSAERQIGCWLACGLAFGLGLLSKYTMAAFLLGFAPLLWQARGDAARRLELQRGAVIVAGCGLLLLAPNLAWNAAHGWPTLAHTADITLAAAPERSFWSRLLRLLEFTAGQALLLGPVALAAGWWLLRRAPAGRLEPLRPALRYAVAMAWPLLLLVALQAGHAQAQINWAAPALCGLALALGLGLGALPAGSASPPSRPLVALVAGALLAAVIASPALWLPEGSRASRADPWARMRGWQEAFAPLPALLLPRTQPGATALLLSSRRDVLAQGRYALREWPQIEWRAIRLGRAAPCHHYELQHGLALDGEARPARWWWLDDRPPPAEALPPGARAEPRGAWRVGTLALQLWVVDETGARP